MSETIILEPRAATIETEVDSMGALRVVPDQIIRLGGSGIFAFEGAARDPLIAPNLQTWSVAKTEWTTGIRGMPLWSNTFAAGVDDSDYQYGPGTVAFAAGSMRFLASASRTWRFWYHGFASPDFVVEAIVTEMPTDGTYAIIGIGAGNNQNLAYGVEYDHIGHTLKIVATYGAGSRFEGASSVAATLTVPFRISLVVAAGLITAWVDDVKLAEYTTYSTLSEQAVLPTFFPCAYHVSNGTGGTTLTSLSSWVYGSVSWRDPHIVTYLDGTTYMEAGEYITTAVDTGVEFDNGYFSSVTGIYAVNPTTYSARRIGKMSCQFTSQTNGKALILSPTVTGILYDSDAGTWYIFSGNDPFTTQFTSARRYMLMWGPLDNSPLSGVQVLPEPTLLALPYVTRQYNNYDYSVVKIGGVWLCAYIESTGLSPDRQLRLARSTDLSSWTLIATNNAIDGEGARIVKVGTTYYILTTQDNGFNCFAFPTDLATGGQTLTHLGTGTLPNFNVGSGPASGHPNLLSVGGRFLIDTLNKETLYSKTWLYGKRIVYKVG